MNVIWDVDSDDDNNDFDNKTSQSKEINFTLLIMVDDISNDMDVETIITIKNINDPITIEILCKIIQFKKPKTQSSTMMCVQTTIPISLKQTSSPKSHEKVIKVALPTSTLEDIKKSNFTNSIIMAPPPPFLTNMTSSSTSTNLEVQFSSKINYFVNLPTDSDESDDEFDLFTISYPSNLVNNKSLSHFRTLAHFDSSTIIFKTRVLEVKKIISIYQINMGELDRT
jgi:hypothetical protein